VSVILVLAAGMLFAIGSYLLMQRKLSRIIVGLGLLGHGANIFVIGSGAWGDPPIIGSGDEARFADPMPEALVLTAIVISFGTTALLLALAYRSWLLTSDDDVPDDIEDREVAGRSRLGAEDDAMSIDLVELDEFDDLDASSADHPADHQGGGAP
jgi:multicomponent Na+:H+ antiporter subunit C